MKKIIFISASISATYVIKRVSAYVDAGYIVEVYAFNRGDINYNYPYGVEVHNMGFVPSGGKYMKKFLHYIPILKEIFLKYKNDNIVYFVTSFDLALLTMLHSKKEYIYHISDLVYGYFKMNFVRSIFRFIDRLIINKSIFTIVTSEGFSSYLKNKNTSSKFVYQPNTLSRETKSKKISAKIPSSIDSLSFGFVGFSRFKTIIRFAEMIGKYYPQHRFMFYGKALNLDEIEMLIKKYPNIKYHGIFKSPEDLSDIYSNIDVVVACYDTVSLNVRLAEPNKLFETIFFGKPIIVSSNTFLEQKVKLLNVGFSVDASSYDDICRVVDSINSERLAPIIDSINNIPISLLIDDNSFAVIESTNIFCEKRQKIKSK